MLTAFFLTDELDGNIVNSTFTEANPTVDGNRAQNVSDPRPKIQWISGWNNTSFVYSTVNFQVDNNNRYLEVSATALGTITRLDVTRGGYSGDQLATAITTQLATLGGGFSWVCTYDNYTGKFTMAGTPDLHFRWQSGPDRSQSLAEELGYDNSADSGAVGSYVSDEARWNTHTAVMFDLSTSPPDLYAFLCDIEAVDPAGTVDDSSVTMYGAATPSGGSNNLFLWQDVSAYELSFSDAPAYTENTIRLAHNSGNSMSARYWLFSWRHQDSLHRHKVGLVKGFDRTWSGTRTVTTLRKHGLLNPQRGLGINNYYPVEQLRRWNVPLAFDAWGASDYRDVIHAAVRHGKQKGMLWALRWDEIADGTKFAQDEADKGYLVWCALQTYSRDTYVGEGADYMSGQLKLEQIR